MMSEKDKNMPSGYDSDDIMMLDEGCARLESVRTSINTEGSCFLHNEKSNIKLKSADCTDPDNIFFVDMVAKNALFMNNSACGMCGRGEEFHRASRKKDGLDTVKCKTCSICASVKCLANYNIEPADWRCKVCIDLESNPMSMPNLIHQINIRLSNLERESDYKKLFEQTNALLILERQNNSSLEIELANKNKELESLRLTPESSSSDICNKLDKLEENVDKLSSKLCEYQNALLKYPSLFNIVAPDPPKEHVGCKEYINGPNWGNNIAFVGDSNFARLSDNIEGLKEAGIYFKTKRGGDLAWASTDALWEEEELRNRSLIVLGISGNDLATVHPASSDGDLPSARTIEQANNSYNAHVENYMSLVNWLCEQGKDLILVPEAELF